MSGFARCISKFTGGLKNSKVKIKTFSGFLFIKSLYWTKRNINKIKIVINTVFQTSPK